VSLAPEYGYGWYAKGICETESGNTAAACSSMRKAANLGVAQAYLAVKQLCR